MNNSTNSAHEINAEIANSGHCPYLSFSKILKDSLNYPIGLIQTSLGGSSLSSWNPNENGGLYRNIISVINICTNGSYKIAGVLWYQGCRNCYENESKTYYERFENVVYCMRRDLNDELLLIYTVQLNKFISEKNAPKISVGE